MTYLPIPCSGVVVFRAMNGYTRLFRHLAVFSQVSKIRNKELVSPTREGGAVLPGNRRLTRGYAHASERKTPAKNMPPGLYGVSSDNTSGIASPGTPKPTPGAIGLSVSKRVKPIVQNVEPHDGTTVDSVPKDDRTANRNNSHPDNAAVLPALEVTPASHSPVVSKSATTEASSDDNECSAKAELGTGGEAIRKGVASRGLDGHSHNIDQQRRCAVIKGEAARALPPIPSDAEVLEVSLD